MGNALTAISRVVYPRPHDQKIPNSFLCNRTCHRFRSASAIAYSGRVARRSTVPGKTSHAYENSNDGIARRNRRIFFACCGARGFTGSEARWQKSGGWGSSWSSCIVFTRCVARSWAESKRHSQESGDSNESFAVTWQILAWRSVQAEKFCGSQSSGREPCHREEHKY